ncbi:hypothetical protein GCM10022222_56830 [Amycolatopsis ultiminotia]|uniref:STAS domain-containing protein n=1 Tax=Amycolatopsis ultiminotia TaxID=543629 RepID=A0ABP6XDZ5_9PSEU
MSAPHHIARSTTLPLADPLGTLVLRVHHPGPRTALVEAIGEVDLASSARLAEVVESRLRSTVQLVVVDLRRTTFLAVSGLRTLRLLQLRAAALGVRFAVDPGESPIVCRLFSLAPLDCARPGAAASLTAARVPPPRSMPPG